MKKGIIFAVFCSVIFGVSCATKSQRVDLDSDILYGDTGITSKDFRTVCEQMARSMIQLPQIANASSPPRISFVRVRNRTSEPLNKDMFLTKIRTLLLKNSMGKMRFVDRSGDMKEAIDEERDMKRDGEVTFSKQAAKSGIDFFLTGELSSIDKTAGDKRATYTVYTFRLADAETGDIVWEDSYEVKKAVTYGAYER